MMLYFDIETYSENGFRSDNTKIITIQYMDHEKRLKILKEWESSEKNILQNFMTELKMMKRDNFLILIGHNVLRFDIPILIRRMAANGIDTMSNLEDFFQNIAVADTMQCLLPFNGMRFKGLSSVEISKKLGIPEPVHRNTEIESFYRNKEFKKIEDHASADLDFVRELYWKLKRDQVPDISSRDRPN